MKRDTIPGTNVSKSLVEVLWESKKVFNEAIYWTQIVKFKGRTFKFVVQKRNGNTKRDCCIMVMNQSGSFDFVADAYEINAPFDVNDYVTVSTDRANFTQLNNCFECLRAMENYVSKVYA